MSENNSVFESPTRVLAIQIALALAMMGAIMTGIAIAEWFYITIDPESFTDRIATGLVSTIYGTLTAIVIFFAVERIQKRLYGAERSFGNL